MCVYHTNTIAKNKQFMQFFSTISKLIVSSICMCTYIYVCVYAQLSLVKHK